MAQLQPGYTSVRVSFLVSFRALNTARSRRFYKQSLRGNFNAAIQAAAVITCGHAIKRCLDLPYFAQIAFDLGGIQVRHEIRHGLVAGISNRSRNFPVPLVIGPLQLALDVIEQMSTSGIELGPQQMTLIFVEMVHIGSSLEIVIGLMLVRRRGRALIQIKWLRTANPNHPAQTTARKRSWS